MKKGTVKKFIVKLASVLMVLGLIASLAGCGGKQQQAASEKKVPTKVRLTMTTWSGYGPLFLARDKGYFEKHGLDVELTVIDGLSERKQALAGNQVDGIATTLNIQSQIQASGIPLVAIWALDDSYGGDGILVRDGINRLEDLKGKTVAYDYGTASHIFLMTVLQKAGMSDKDIKSVQMTAGDAGAAFVAGKVDAAVTWEPWLSKATSAGKGKVLIDSKETPGLITDVVALKKEFVDAHPEVPQALVDALAEAMEYWKKNPKESNALMAKGLGTKPESFESDLKSIRLYDLDQNKELLGTAEKQGPLYSTFQQIIDFYYQIKMFDEKPDPEQMIDPSYVQKANV